MIKKLKSNLINQIAAGEVVDDPSSIVKELIENSIDAKSTSIELILFNSGISKIIVNDNGTGIAKKELQKAFERFATSKIQNLDDLNEISTLGFRGEALPSIASISEVTVSSYYKNEGNEIKILFGKEIHLKPSSIEEGTSVHVDKIFHNVPARKKFLKSENSEYRKILTLFKKIALCNYNISMKLINNEKTIYNFKSSDLYNRILALYGNKVKDSLIEVSYEKDKYKINGFVGNLSLVKASRGHQYLYVNNRHINNSLINTSIYSSFKSLLSRGEYPLFVLFLELPTTYLDINVHPKKQEVKFQNDLQIQHIFKKSISDSLKNILNTIPEYTNINFNTNDVIIEELPFNNTTKTNESLVTLTQDNKYEENIKNAEFRLKQITDNKVLLDAKNIWQIHNKYIITEITSGLIIIDQHVAHERILYESAKENLEQKGITSQKMLFPKVVKFDPEEYTYLLDIIYYLEKIGFDFREFGENSIIIEGSPNNLPFGKEEDIIKDIIDQYKKTKKADSEFIEYLAATYACKAAIKAGDKLDSTECRELVDKLFSTKHPYYCPHGRPIIVNLTINDLDKRFERH